MRRMMPFAGVSIFALCVGGALLPASPTHASDIVVTPTSLNGWAFSNTDNSGTNASGQFVVGPAPAPLGIGSANLIVGDATSSEILINTSVAPGSSSFTTLSYETYVTTSTPGSGAAPTLQFDLYDGATYEGRLVFDPGLLGTVTDDTWQTWDPLTEDAWYFSDSTHSTKAVYGECSIAGPTYCSIGQAEADLSADSTVLDDVLFKAGSDQSSFNGNVDNFQIAFSTTSATYDFEPSPAAVPEPASLALFGAALAGFGVFRRRRRKAA